MKKKAWGSTKLSLKKMTITHLSLEGQTQILGGKTVTNGCAQPTTTVQHTRLDCPTYSICDTYYSLRCTTE